MSGVGSHESEGSNAKQASSRDSRSDFIAWRIACKLVVYASNSHVPCYAGARHRAAAEAAQRCQCGVGCKEVGVNLAVSEL